VQDHLDCKNYYAFNPNFDSKQANSVVRQRGMAKMKK